MNRSDIVQHICDLTLAELIEKTKVCPHAWNGLYMGPDGNVKMCTRNRAMLGDAIIKQSSEYRSYDDLVNSSVQLDARTKMLSNTLPKICSQCMETELINSRSHRIHVLEKYFSDPDWRIALKNTNDAGYITDQAMFKVKHLMIQPLNTCNLKCRFCKPLFSSAMHKEFVTHNIKIWREYDADANMNVYNDVIDRNIDVMTSLNFGGGEPFLQPLMFDALDRVANDGIEIFIDTNCMQTAFKNKSFFDIAAKSKNKFIVNLSIDDIGKRIEYSRHGAKWDVIEQNLINYMNIAKECPNIKLTISVGVSIFNVMYLDELYSYIRNLGYTGGWKTVTTVFPLYLAPNLLPKHIRDNLIQSSAFLNNKKIICVGDVVSLLMQDCEQKDLLDFFTMTEKFDKIREESFDETFPDLSSIMRQTNDNR